MKIIALHGFLGQPADFKVLGLPGLIACNIFNTQICPLNNWAERFNRNISAKPILLGYSMGGRLALHCLLQAAHLFSGAIILAANPGLADLKARRSRYLADLKLGRAFLYEPWPDLMFNWNNQGALKNSKPIDRPESSYSRTALCSAMRYFSLGSQEYLTPRINQVNLPILWMLSEDEKENINNLKLKHHNSQILKIQNACHRFMFNQPQIVCEAIEDFTKNIALISSGK